MELVEDIWQRSVVCQLIQLYHDHPVLWDSSNEFFKYKKDKYAAWNDMADALKLPREEVERKMRCLIGQYQRESKKPNGTRWIYFGKMEFLKDKKIPQGSREGGLPLNDKVQLLIVNNQRDPSEAGTSSEEGTLATATKRNSKRAHNECKKGIMEISAEASNHNLMHLVPASFQLETKNEVDPLAEAESSIDEDEGTSTTSMRTSKRIRNESKRTATMDEFETFALHVALQIRKLSKFYQARAKLKIAEVLYEVEMSSLEEGCRKSRNTFQ